MNELINKIKRELSHPIVKVILGRAVEKGLKRVVQGEVKQTLCCCAAPGHSRKECATAQGNKTPCRCDCHPRKSNHGR